MRRASASQYSNNPNMHNFKGVIKIDKEQVAGSIPSENVTRYSAESRGTPVSSHKEIDRVG